MILPTPTRTARMDIRISRSLLTALGIEFRCALYIMAFNKSACLHRLFFSVSIIVLVLYGKLWAAEFYMSPAGDDRNAGTKALPFASLERARDAVRAAKELRPAQNCTVWLRGGVYRLKETV